MRIWRWVFNLSIFGLLLWFVWHRFELFVYTRLAPESSLFSQFVWLITAVILILFFISALHEVGHLVAGWLVGLRFHLLIIGPIRFARQRGALRVQWQLNGSLFNGLAASIPPDETNLVRRMLVFAAGGPLASLLVMGAAAVLALFLQADSLRQLAYLWLWECALFTAVVSYFFFLTSIKPGVYQNGLPADGARIAMLLRNNRQAHRWCALVVLNSRDIFGQRPRDWSVEKMEAALSAPDDSHDHLTALIMAYQMMWDKGDWSLAEGYLQEALALPIAWTAGMRARLALEEAYVQACWRQNAQEAREWLQQVRRGRRYVAQQLRAEAAVYWVEKEGQLARQTAVQAQQLLRKEEPTGVALAEMDWLQTIIAQAEIAA
jgi:hypothetical protein